MPGHASMKPCLLFVFPTLAALLLVGTASTHAADWPLQRGDAGLTGVSRDTIPNRPSLLWTFKTIPEPGETVRFWFKEDFTIQLTHKANRWQLDFGPRTKVEAGLFEFNDTLMTPVRVLNVALWVDASVLGIIIDDMPDQVVVKAIGQGEIGDVKNVELYAIPKERTQ